MRTEEIKQKDSKYIINTYARYNLLLQKSKRGFLYGEGKRYIDFGGGIAVNTFGNADKTWAKVVCKQLKKLCHISNLYYSEHSVLLAEELCRRTGLAKVFFSNSGAEANECAIKCARKYSSDKYGENRYEIIALKDSFHGRTIATLSATGQEEYHNHFSPFLKGFVFTEPSMEGIENCISQKTCAVIIELIQGEGGVNVLSRDFVKKLSKMCIEKDILLIIDEVQSGNGRTGSLYAYMHYDIIPDILTTAKGLGGGLPIGVTIFGDKTANTLEKGQHGSTFGGNLPIVRGALNILERIDEKFLAQVRAKGEFIKSEILNMPKVKSISGRGLMMGIEIEGEAKEVVQKCMEKGLLILTAKHKLRILPPLNIKERDIKKALNILREVLT